MLSLELDILRVLEVIRNEFLNGLFGLITMLGEETIIIVLMAVIYFIYDKDLARRLFFITAMSLSLNCIVKNFVKRPRPFTRGISAVRESTATGYSFPSGHTQTFATWSNALMLKLKNKKLLLITVILSALVGFSRIYLGVHYPTDVIAGLVLGLLFAYFGNKIYDKTKNKNVLYTAVLLLMTPFSLFFIIKPDPLYEDFFKLYGMLAGFLLAVMFEGKCVKLDNDTTLAKKFVRIVVCVVLALIIKEALKALFSVQNLRFSLFLDTARYFILVFSILGLCPLMFKKLNM